MNTNYDSLYNRPVSQGKILSASDKLSQSGSLLGSLDFSTIYDKSINQQNKTQVGQPTNYEDIFQKAGQEHGVPVSLLKAVAKAESGFNAKAVSSCGAKGIMQLMPGTAAGLGVVDAFDPQQNIMGGAKYLGQMLTRYNGDVKMALAGYNAGPGNVKKYGGIPPFKETQNYIAKVLGYAGDNMKVTQPTNTLETQATGLQIITGSSTGITTGVENSIGLGNVSNVQDSLSSGILSASKGDPQQVTTLFLLQLLELQNKSAGSIGRLEMDEG